MHTTWFVTGASSRLGIDIVMAALAQGAHVIATDGDASALAAAFACLRPPGSALHLRGLDVADGRAVAAAIDDALARLGRLDVLVHGEPLRQDGDAAGRWPATALVRGLFNVTRSALPPMRVRRAGRIHHLVPPAKPGAGPSLFSIAAFCEAVAADVVDDGITVNAIAPADAHARLFAGWSRRDDRLLEAA